MNSNYSPIVVKVISSEKFKSYAMFSKKSVLTLMNEEVRYFANEDESLLGVVSLDKTDLDFSCAILCKDKSGRFRAMKVEVSIQSLHDAEEWVVRMLKFYTGIGIKVFAQGDESSSIDLFDTSLSKGKKHPYFIRLKDDLSFSAARELISKIAPHFVDVDGNFAEQFQTAGFDARIWELYLYCYLKEDGFEFDRTNNRPDFIVKKDSQTIAIEAVTVGRKSDNPARYQRLNTETDLRKIISSISEEKMSINFHNSLHRKLDKKYWDLKHITNTPIIIAIADFHEDFSMSYSFSALLTYIYGIKTEHHYDENGSLVVESTRITKHKYGKKEAPSGFFSHAETQHISAIMTSPVATISKFNRIGKQAGFGNPKVHIFRLGAIHDHDPNASVPINEVVEVNETSDETWAEGISLYHNPKALFPISYELFPSAAHHAIIDDKIQSTIPNHHPYLYFTVVTIPMQGQSS